MKILSIDTSNEVASVAIMEDEEVLQEKVSEDQKTHSEKLLPMVDEVLHETKIDISEIDEFCVCTGPGSFTGIRIGVSTVKGMAQALNKKIIPVTALEALIESAGGENVCAIIDAKHENVYTQYKINGEYMLPGFKNIVEMIAELKNVSEEITFIGSGALIYKKVLEENLICKIKQDTKAERASDLVKFAYEIGRCPKNPEDVNPVYLRKAQPEREQ